MENHLVTIKNILSAFLAFLIIYLMHVLSSLFMPLALALFIAIILQPALLWLERKKWPYALSLTVVSVTTLGILYLFGMLFYKTGQSIMEQKEYLLLQINDKLSGIIGWVNTMPGVDFNSDNIVGIISSVMSYDSLLKSSGQFAGLLGDFTGSFFMTALYLIGILGGILKYEQYISYLEKGDIEKEKKLLAGFETIKASIVTYMKVKVFVSFLTGLSYFLICLAFGIKFALFWGFLAFLLNFIPTVGSIVASIPPVLFGLIQFESLGTVGLLMLLLLVVQIVMGNILEPKITGNILSLNTVVVILGLVFWGYLWGVTGMILSVPLLVLTKVVLSQMPDAQMFVRLMGGGPEKENLKGE